MISSNKKLKLLSLLLFSIFIVFIYSWKLNLIPVSFHGDEGETSMQALDVLSGKTGLIGVGWFDLPLLSFLPHSITIAIFGRNMIGARMGSVIFGLLSLPFYYLLSKELFNKRLPYSLLFFFLLQVSG